MNRARGWLLAAVALTAMIIGVSTGAVPLSLAAVWEGLRHGDTPVGGIVRGLRVPRVLLGFVVGGSLGVSGAALQALVRNPLAEPYILGLSGGAGLGAVAAIALDVGGAWAVPLAALAGALSAIALVYRLSHVASHRIDPRVLLLAGVVVGSFATAVMSAIITLSDAVQLRNAFLWLLGGLGGASWPTLGLFASYAVLPLALLFLNARSLDLLVLGEETAMHLGVDAQRSRRVVYFATALLTAASVAVCGIVGFVGLVVPHAMRRLFGSLHRPLLPAVFVAGGVLLVLADALARTVVRPLEMPVGVVTALIGVPLFAVLLRKTLA